jgi:hypothetical protein
MARKKGGWVIRSTKEYGWGGVKDPLYWNNEDGWVDKGSATVFGPIERLQVRLPIGGVWEKRG